MTKQDTFPFASIVVISRDRHKLLEEAVRSLLEVAYPSDRYEIIVVEEADEPQPIRQTNYIFLPRRNLGLAYARNQGVKHSKGDIILFTDDDCIVDRDWLKNMVQIIVKEGVGGVAGTTLAQDGNAIGKCEEIMGFPGGGVKRYVKSGGRIEPTKLLSGCNCAYDKKVFETMTFEEKGVGILGGDDCMLGIQVSEKYGCKYNPNAIVYHKPRGNLFKIVKWFERRRINEFLYEEKEHGTKNYYTLLRGLHKSVLLRILIILTLILCGAFTSIIAFALIIFYFCVLYYKHLRIIIFTKEYSTVFVLPIVKIFMDIGILKAEIKYIFCPYKTLFGVLSEYRR